MSALTGGIVGFVVLAVVAVVGLSIISNLGTNYVTGVAGCNSTHKTSCGGEYNASLEVTEAVGSMTSYFGILALVLIAGVILYFLMRKLSM